MVRAALDAIPGNKILVRPIARCETPWRIAAALFLTEHSVEEALRRIYHKLGVRSRAELAHRVAISG
jgi:DNA-binding CsgD family transcriptional regulator